MKKGFILGILVFAAGIAAYAALDNGLDGTNWKMRERGITSIFLFWQRDELAFRDGSFTSLADKSLGYVPAVYAATKIRDGIEWTATLESAKDGKIIWEGRRVGNKMTGSYSWTSIDGTGTRTAQWTAHLIPAR